MVEGVIERDHLKVALGRLAVEDDRAPPAASTMSGRAPTMRPRSHALVVEGGVVTAWAICVVRDDPLEGPASPRAASTARGRDRGRSTGCRRPRAADRPREGALRAVPCRSRSRPRRVSFATHSTSARAGERVPARPSSTSSQRASTSASSASVA